MFLPSLSDLATQFCTQREGAIFLDEPFILCRQDFANFGTRFYTVTLAHVANVHDASSNPVSVFSVENATQSPGISSNTRDNACGAVGLCSWPKRLLWNGSNHERGAFQSLLLCSAAGCRKVRQGYRRPCKTSHNHARPCDVSQPGHSASIGRDRASAPHWGHYLVTSGRQCKALLENLWQDQCRPSTISAMDGSTVVRPQKNVRRAWQADLTGAREKQNATPGVIAQARREARLATRKKIEAPSSASKSHLTSYDGVKKHGSLPVVPRKAVVEVSKIENYREASCCDAWMAERTDEPKGGWSCAFWSGCSGHLTHNCWM